MSDACPNQMEVFSLFTNKKKPANPGYFWFFLSDSILKITNFLVVLLLTRRQTREQNL